MKPIYLSVIAMALTGQSVAAQTSASDVSSSNLSGSVISGLINDHVAIGTAYDSQKKRFLNVQPVSGVVDETFGNTELKFKTGIDMSYDDMLNTLNGSVDVDVNFPVVRVSAGASLAKEMASSTYSSSYTFSAASTPKKRLFLPKNQNQGFVLSQVGNDIANNHQTKLQTLVGDEFVTGVEYGANVLVNLKIDYGSNKDKSDIGGYLDVDLYGGVFNVGGQLRYLKDETKSSVKITVRAVQQGGDPKQLLSIIPNNIITCSLDNPKPCFDMFYEAVKYAKTGFNSQLNSLSDYNVVRYYTTRYENSSLALRGLVPEYQIVRNATKWLTTELEDDFKQAILDEQRADKLLNSYYAYLPETQRIAVERIKNLAYDNAWFFFNAAQFCRDNPFGYACENKVQEMKNACVQRGKACPASYNVTDLQLPSTDQQDWKQCELARQEAVRAGVVTEEESARFRNLRWAPTFIEATAPARGILNWRLCEGALSTYGNAFAQ
ncbi:internalin [Pseudoalteromonas luteoviolacea]|uniref:internalin n=1 Tax=Pseudoalteromonas luteoviolacea TaxID=43657 RepID=UPI001F3E3DC1|nr:internalin [Pseudoalteromonas luteoviolacea]MCF6441565.1 internalin [Pseudoalteromonas luteoviolacea]